MATTTSTLKINADNSQAIAALRQLVTSLGQAESAAKKLESSFSGATREVSSLNSKMSSLKSTGSGLSSVFSNLAAAIGVGTIIKAADTYTQFQNTIKSVSGSQEELQTAMEGVQNIANQTGTPLAQVGTLYAKLTIAGQQLGVSQDRVLQATRGVSQQMKQLGLGAGEAQSVMYQFGQAVGLGYARMEEMKQIMEASPAFMKNMAAQFGKTTTQFLADVASYKVGSEDLINAQARMADNAMWGKYQQTVGDALIKVSNNFQILLGRLESGTGIFAKIANTLDWVGKNLDLVTAAGMAFFTMFALKKIMDITTAFITLNGVMKANPWVLVASLIASAGVALYSYMQTSKEAAKVIETETKAQEELNKATLDYVGIKLDLVALKTQAEEFGKQQQFLAQIAPLGKARQEQEKAVAEFAKAQNLQYDLLVQKAPSIAKMIRDQVSARQGAELRAQVEQDILTIGKEIDIINAKNIVQQEQLKAAEKLRAQFGIELTGTTRDRLNLAIEEKVYNSEFAKYDKERAVAKSDLKAFTENMNQLSLKELEIAIKQASATREIGKATSQLALEEQGRISAAISTTENLRNQLNYYREIKKNVESITTPKTGLEAGSLISGRLAELSPSVNEQKILTDRQTTLNGLKDLMDRGVISEKEYQEGRVTAEQEANSAILASRQKMMEQQMQSQGVVNTEIISMVKDQMAAVSMMQQGGIVGVQGALSALTNVFGLMQGGSRKAFESYKALATAQALISTYQAAAMSIAAPPGPPFSYIYVASAILAGMAQVAKIRSMQYSGRAVGGPVVGGQSYLVGERGPEIFTPGTAGGIVKNSDIGGGGTTVNFNITATDATSFDQLLVNRRGLITQIINDAMTEKGRRGI